MEISYNPDSGVPEKLFLMLPGQFFILAVLFVNTISACLNQLPTELEMKFEYDSYMLLVLEEQRISSLRTLEEQRISSLRTSTLDPPEDRPAQNCSTQDIQPTNRPVYSETFPQRNPVKEGQNLDCHMERSSSTFHAPKPKQLSRKKDTKAAVSKSYTYTGNNSYDEEDFNNSIFEMDVLSGNVTLKEPVIQVPSEISRFSVWY